MTGFIRTIIIAGIGLRKRVKGDESLPLASSKLDQGTVLGC